MKVAVISPDKTSCGKSSFIYLLAGVYSRSQAKSVSIYSLADTVEDKYMVTLNGNGVGTKSPTVFKAMMETSSIGKEDIHDYAIRVGKEDVYLFDFYSCSLDTYDKDQMLVNCMALDSSNLVLVELHETESRLSKEILEQCDQVIVMFGTSPKSINAIKTFKETSRAEILHKASYVISQYNPNVMSESKLSKFTGIAVRNTLQFPYNTLIAKETLEGTLDTLCSYIVRGHYELANMRPKMQEVMQVLFDTGRTKSIKPINEWRQ